MFSTQQIPCSTDFQVFHRNLETASEIRELLNRFETFSRIGSHHIEWWRYQVTECFSVATPYSSTHLVQVCHSETLCIIDENCICIRDIHPRFYDSSRNQNIIFPFHEIEDIRFHLFPIHLSVTGNDPCIRNQSLDQPGNIFQVFDSVVDEINLSIALQFVGNCIPDNFFAEANDTGIDRLSVGWWRFNYR